VISISHLPSDFSRLMLVFVVLPPMTVIGRGLKQRHDAPALFPDPMRCLLLFPDFGYLSTLDERLPMEVHNVIIRNRIRPSRIYCPHLDRAHIPERPASLRTSGVKHIFLAWRSVFFERLFLLVGSCLETFHLKHQCFFPDAPDCLNFFPFTFSDNLYRFVHPLTVKL